MSRDIIINGESLVRVRFGNHITATNIPGGGSNLSELGLAVESIKISPRFVHYDVHIDDFGSDIPVETQWLLADVRVSMSLIHFDYTILGTCLGESMGGGQFAAGNEGTMAPAGLPLGGGLARLASGWHYIGLNILSPVRNIPWRFPAAYLAEQPAEIPLGTKRTMAQLNWRAIPYVPFSAGEMLSSGAVVWDHSLDV